MYARLTSIQVHPAKLEQLTRALPAIGAQLKALPGLVECKAFRDADGKGVVLALYESQGYAEAADTTIRGIWGGLASLLAAQPTTHACPVVMDLLE